jgi:hypothetical protein
MSILINCGEDQVSADMTCLLGISLTVCRTGFSVARAEYQCSYKSYYKYNSKLFHTEIILIDYKNKLFILKTTFVPEINFWHFFTFPCLRAYTYFENK